MKIFIRPALLEDVPAVVNLAGQLGYPVEIETMRSRLAAILEEPYKAVLLAESDGQVSGWIYLLAGQELLTGPTAEIGGLVVDENQRGHGIGKALLEQAQEWAIQQECSELRVHSNTAREPYVKEFYLAAGFELVKTQWVLKRPLVGSCRGFALTGDS
jgi:N-acetylglutamate synthase-like GNAT family acetyltransferase